MKSNIVNLSTESQIFLDNLRVYLFSCGKNSDEIEGLVEELEVHLIETEKKGKSIDNIIGQSPKDYMNQLSKEMTTDFPAWIKYIAIIILGSFIFTIINDLLKGKLSYSILGIFGHITIGAIFILGIFSAFKYISSNNISKGKEFAIYYILGLLPISLFIGLIFLNKIIETPMIHFGTTGTIITGIITIVFLIIVSLWAKTWVSFIFLALLILPDYLLRQSELNEVTQIVVSTFITIGGIALYSFITLKKDQK